MTVLYRDCTVPYRSRDCESTVRCCHAMTSCTALKRGNIARSSGDGRRSLVVSFARVVTSFLEVKNDELCCIRTSWFVIKANATEEKQQFPSPGIGCSCSPHASSTLISFCCCSSTGLASVAACVCLLKKMEHTDDVNGRNFMLNAGDLPVSFCNKFDICVILMAFWIN